MTDVLLTSATFVRDVTAISDNVAGKYLQPAIREAQEFGLRFILGDALTDRLKEIVAAGTAGDPGNEPYRDLLDKCQYFLAYRAASEVAQKTSFKVANFGVVKTTDENAQVATQDEVAKVRYYFDAKADGHAASLQRWLLDNAAAFPELGQGGCARIKANLTSSASCGLWLGGPRGKYIRK